MLRHLPLFAARRAPRSRRRSPDHAIDVLGPAAGVLLPAP